MTLVLQCCTDQSSSFDPLRFAMPCVYDGEHLDFESALMTGEWPTLKDIATEYEQQAEESAKATPVNGDRNLAKRKLSAETNRDGQGEVSETKKPCPDGYLNSPFAEIVKDEEASTSVNSTTQEVTTEDEDDQFPPRRRGPQMWNSRQRWKDERKKVLKMSVGKLTEIEDPELWLLRSVLINNTIKRLHQDIRNERQAKVRHRQQKLDFYHDGRFDSNGPSSTSFDGAATSSPSNLSPYDAHKKLSSTTTSDIYDDTSCDEIFGISEDFLRVTIPDRRMSSSPIPGQDKDSPMDVDPPVSRPDQNRAAMPPRTHVNHAQQRASPCNQQCSTQYRTNDGTGGGGGTCCNGDTFPPRVPILDSVVYHSLLASLESS